MNYFFEAKKGNPIPRIHPLLLSLCEAIEENETSPSIGSIREDDSRVLGSKFYTSPKELPPLDIHLSSQTGVSPLLNPEGFALILADGCRKCAFQDDPVRASSTTAAVRKLKRRRASSGVQEDSRKRKAKGKQAQKAIEQSLNKNQEHSEFTAVYILGYGHNAYPPSSRRGQCYRN
jgi:hypothetical protein